MYAELNNTGMVNEFEGREDGWFGDIVNTILTEAVVMEVSISDSLFLTPSQKFHNEHHVYFYGDGRVRIEPVRCTWNW